MAKRLTAKQLRAAAEWDVEIEAGFTVRVRRVDMVTAYMTGMIPMPLMATLGRLMRAGPQIMVNPAYVESLPEEDRGKTVELLRRFVCAAVIDPVFVMEDDGNPDHAPVRALTAEQLLKIWQSGPSLAPQPEVSAETAEEFRQSEGQDRDAVSHGPEVRPAPEQLPDADIQQLVFG